MSGRFLEIPLFLGDYFLCRTLYIVNSVAADSMCVDVDDDDGDRFVLSARRC